jgi:hypothetical protein
VSPLILKRASASRPSGEWNEDDFDVLADGAVVGRIFKANATPVGMSWMWTLSDRDAASSSRCSAARLAIRDLAELDVTEYFARLARITPP